MADQSPSPSPSPPPPPSHTTNNHEEEDTSRVPLLQSIITPLDRSLRRLETFLCLLGLCPFSLSASALPFHPLLLPSSVFLLFGLALPTLASVLSRCSHTASSSCEDYEVDSFDNCVLVSQAAVAAVSIACVSRSLCKYGISRFLFVDQRHCRADSRFQKEYLAKIQGFFRLVIWWIIPCLLVKIAREVFRFMHLLNDSTWRAVVVLLASIVSWTYLTSITLSSCTLFHLVCNLHVIHFEDYCKLLEQDLDPMLYLEEHVNLRYNLSKISHRFRMFLLLLFSCVTATLFVVLYITTAYGGKINFTNAGDIAVSSVVHVVGLALCLHAAAKISHRAQGIASLASRWHALITCSTSNNDSNSTLRVPSSGNLVSLVPANFLTMDYAESDLESLENGPVPSNTRLVSYMSSYHKREALVLYLLANPGGITIFGWTIDRGLLNTILMFELSLVLFVLGKTFVLPNSNALVNSVLGLF
ncbi:hypothetical protein LUZ62_020342 [Rhynchospora pubera]|uniref:Uncharacterized protein n=1 Tax=Rhynchospora pubera TaxID=906938 RepID=A0AAV8GX06_9POAL|nr:hypothetical protein LUZ62_020342 [Rhynchospora pubera]